MIIVVIIFFILLTLLIQYIVKLKPLPPNYDDTKSFNQSIYTAMITSRISSIDNECYNLYSAIVNFTNQVPNKHERLFFHTGDIISSTLDTNKILTDLITYFDVDKIFYQIDFSKGDKNLLNKILYYKIFVPKRKEELQLFMECGYYKKHIPNTTMYVILFSDLSDNCIYQINQDLENIYNSKQFVYIICNSNLFWEKVNPKYKSIVRGILSGYGYDKLNNLDTWDIGEYKAHTWNIPPISSYIKIPLPLNEPLELSKSDVWKNNC
jgi:hypothetical protein